MEKINALHTRPLQKLKNTKRRNNMFKKYLNNEKGFSMIEMMVVLIIIAVLIAGGIRFYLGYIENSRVTKAKAQISTMQAALDAYYAENADYPKGDDAADAAGLTSALINAGIKVIAAGADSGIKTSLEQKDPWAVEYVYEVNDSKQCIIYTGYGNVQDTNAYVAGRCDNGKSEMPEIEEVVDDESTPPIVL
jgi:general secretion pathway protein G